MKTIKISSIFLLIVAIFSLGGLKVNAQGAAGPMSSEQQAKILLGKIKVLQNQLAELLENKYPSGVITKNNRTLTIGMTGEDVEELQKSLSEEPDVYPEGLVTGYFGPLTQKAVKNFQEKYIGIIPTGEVDQITDETIKAIKAAKLKKITGGIFATPFYDKPNQGTSTPEVPAPGLGQTKVMICHVPPGNPSNAKTIIVGEPALSAHLANGSYKGECEDEDSDFSDAQN